MKKRVMILATGGTIVSSGESALQMTGYRLKDFRVEDLIRAVPELEDLATLEAWQIANIDSSSMTSEVWLDLARAADEAAAREDVAGVVITHGTDTLEETAYFLHLTLRTEKPVVLVGAMRPSTALSAEGPLNLLNAVRIATDPRAVGRGVLVALNDTILSAREATKTHPTNVATFRGPDAGLLGLIAGGRIEWLSRSDRPHTAATPFALENLTLPLPRVDIVLSHADDDGTFVRAALAAGARGVVHAGTGNGSIHKNTEPALFEAARRGVLVVRASRVGSGATVEGLDAWQEAGFIPSGTLNPQKARILLQLSLARWGDKAPAELRELASEAFRTY